LAERHAELLNQNVNDEDKKRIQNKINELTAQKLAYKIQNNKLEKK
jgi:hypothetical protein